MPSRRFGPEVLLDRLAGTTAIVPPVLSPKPCRRSVRRKSMARPLFSGRPGIVSRCGEPTVEKDLSPECVQ